jgi:quercetin dioxygenase-like cupin family protein
VTIIGQKIEVPKNPTVVASSSVFAPGARTPVHKHLYPHYVYVQDGTLTIVSTETGKSFDMKPGTFFLEMIDKWHYGINKGAVPVHTLVIDQVPVGVGANHVLKDPKEAAGWSAH